MSTNCCPHRCAKCNKIQPENGKILTCFHIVCPGCAIDSVNAESNSITCSLCEDVTEPHVTGIPLVQQLPSCEPSLYNSADTTSQIVAAASGGEERLLCDLCDEGSEGEATHSCCSCNGIRLCGKHVEHHSRKRAFAGHVVALLSDHQCPHKVATSSRCFFHNRNDVITFCMTCSYAVCAECVSSGHGGHTIETLQSVVDKEISSIKGMVESMVASGDATSGSPLKEISSLIEAGSEAMEEIREEARIASTAVTHTFDRIESVLLEKRQELLRKIDETQWRQLHVSETRQRRLFRLEETHATVGRLTDSLTRGEISNTEVFRVAGMLKNGLEKMNSDIQSAQVPQRCTRFAALPSTEAIRQIEEEIVSMMQVCEAGRFNVTECIVALPDYIYTGEEFSALITLPIPPDGPTAEITASYVAPSTQRSEAPISRSTDMPRAEMVLSAQIKPMEEGNYTLEIRDYADRVKSVTFPSAKPGHIVLDPQKCSSNITLSNDNLTATYTGAEDARVSVASQDGYTTGKHSWNVRVCNGNAGGYCLAFGVTGLSPCRNYDKHGSFFGSDYHYIWYTNGSCSATPAGQRAKCPRIEDGGTATLTLDCENSTLELHIHRTGAQYTITGMDCTQRLFPALCMRRGHKAEFF